MEVAVGNTKIESKREIKYLGVIDERLKEEARKIYQRKDICNPRSTDEDGTKC